MADYSALKATIDASINTNGQQAITGAILNDVLNEMVDVLGEGYTFLGVATPTTNPTTPEGKAYYLAGAAGTYSNFGNIVVASDEVALLVWNGTAWSKVVTGAASKEEVSQLGQEVKQSLKQGYCKANGVITAHVSRLTTGVLRINGVVIISCNQNYRIQLLAGNGAPSASNQMTDIGYVSDNGAPYKYTGGCDRIAINVVSLTSITPADYEKIGLIITSEVCAPSSIGNTVEKEKDIIEISDVYVNNGDNVLNIVSGARQTGNAKLSASTVSLSSSVIRHNGDSIISCNVGYICYVYGCATKGGDFTMLTPVSGIENDTPFHLQYDGYIYIRVVREDGATISVGEPYNIKFIKYDESIVYPNFVFSVVGSPGSLKRYKASLTLLGGVRYKFSFASNSFSVQTGQSEYFSIYTLPKDGVGSRTNILACTTSTLPSITYYTPSEDCVLIAANRLTADSYVDITISRDLSKTETCVRENANEIMTVQSWRMAQIARMFVDGQVVSDLQDKLTISNGYDIRESDGEMCIGIAGNSTSPAEAHTTDAYHTDLALCNIADICGTKSITRIATKGDIFPSLGHAITSMMNVIAKWTGDDEVSILFGAGWSTDTGYVVRKYHPSTNTLDNDVTVCDINVLGTVYPCTNNQANIEAIWSSAGFEHPVGRSGVNEYKFLFGMDAIKIGEYFYAAVTIGNFSHPLCRTTDLIHWEYVCDIPFGQSTEEVALCYYRNNIYATSRGNTINNVTELSKIMYCNFDNLGSSNWTTPIELTGCCKERPTIVGVDGYLYVLQGLNLSSLPIDSVDKNRMRRAFLLFDTELNLLQQMSIEFEVPILHPEFRILGGNIISVQSTDVRGFGVTSEGDGRSEIMVTRIDKNMLFRP